MGRLCGGKWIPWMKAGKPHQLYLETASYPQVIKPSLRAFRRCCCFTENSPTKGQRVELKQCFSLVTSSGEKPELSPGSAELMKAMSLSVNDFSLPVSSFLRTKIKWIILFQMNNKAKLYNESYDTHVIIIQDFYVLLLFERDLFYSILFSKRNITFKIQ